jgi:peptide/nickel transport system substrate-binding protein
MIARKLNRRSVLIGGGGIASVAAGAALFGSGPRPDKRFTVVVNQIPPVLDFSKAGSSVNLLRPTLENMVETLLENDDVNGVRPGVCSWVMSDDARTIEYRVRPNVRFHTGDLLTAHDIKFSHDRLLKGLPSYRSRCYDLDRVEVVDDERIRFYFKTSGGTYLRTRGTYVYSQAYHKRVGEERFSTEPVGTGPYRLSQFRSAEYIDLDAFDGYWGAPPPIKSARIAYVIEDMTRVAMLRAGEADLVMAVPFSMVPVLARLGFWEATADVHPTFSIRFQMVNPHTPWADQRVRLAMAHAVDSDAIIKGVFGGVPKRFAGFGPTEAGYDPTLKPFTYDPDLSRRLLAEAGYPHGFKMPLYYFTNNYYGSRETAELVTLYLRKIGIDVDARALDSAHALSFNREHSRDPNAVIVTLATAVFANYSDPVEAMRFSYGTRPPNSYYRSTAFDKLIERAVLARTPEERAVALRACQWQMRKDVPLIPLWNNVVVYMSQPGVRFTPTQRDVPLMRLKDITRV